MEGEYVKLGNLYVYRISLELCDIAWEVYEPLDWRTKKIMGDQFIESVDSNAANIAEGYGRFHYLDKIKFYYNARGSLLEAHHWCHLLNKRGRMSKERYQKFFNKARHVHYTLNNFISSTFHAKDKE